MQEETILLTQLDRDRLKVPHEVSKARITRRNATEQLKVADRWIRTLVGRIEGDRAMIHGLRGRPSTQRVSDTVQKRAIEIVKREYADFGPTPASEYLRQVRAVHGGVHGS